MLPGTIIKSISTASHATVGLRSESECSVSFFFQIFFSLIPSGEGIDWQDGVEPLERFNKYKLPFLLISWHHIPWNKLSWAIILHWTMHIKILIFVRSFIGAGRFDWDKFLLGVNGRFFSVVFSLYEVSMLWNAWNCVLFFIMWMQYSRQGRLWHPVFFENHGQIERRKRDKLSYSVRAKFLQLSLGANN